MSTFQALHEVIGESGLFGSLYTDRASHYWQPAAGGKVDTPTQVGRALAQLGIELIAAYSPEARGRSERMFGTLQKRLPQELRLAGITTMEDANRYLKEVFWPAHNRRFARPAEASGSAAFAGTLADILGVQHRRQVGNDNTVRYDNLILQIPADRQRHHYAKAEVRVHEYPDASWPSSTDPGAWPATRPTAPCRNQQGAGRVTRRATGRRALWTSGQLGKPT